MEQLLFPLLLLVPLLLLILRQRKQQRAFVEQQGRVRPGMRVMTTAGLYGTVVSVEDDVMVLEVADGVLLRWSKLAVGRIVDTPEDDVDDAADSTARQDDLGDLGDGGDDPTADTARGATVDIRKPTRGDVRADGP